MEYPHTIKNITINGVNYRMWAPSLGLSAKLEDENNAITFLDILTECTDIPVQLAEAMQMEEIEEICKDVMSIGADGTGEGDALKAIEIIAVLLNKGHREPQKYKLDFVSIIFKEYAKAAGK